MKKWILAGVGTLALTMSLTANAQNEQPIPMPTPDPTKEIKPIRIAKAHYRVRKATITKMPDGSGYKSETVVICDKMVDAPVYDYRNVGTDSWSRWDVQTTCKTTIKGQEIEINLYPAISINNFDPFYGSQTPGVDGIKTFHASFFGFSSNRSLSENQAAWSRDINQRTIGLDLGTGFPLCMSSGTASAKPKSISPQFSGLNILKKNQEECDPTSGESFFATVEFED